MFVPVKFDCSFCSKTKLLAWKIKEEFLFESTCTFTQPQKNCKEFNWAEEYSNLKFLEERILNMANVSFTDCQESCRMKIGYLRKMFEAHLAHPKDKGEELD